MKYNILIVDDEPDVILLLKDYFEINNYKVYTASSGEEAIRQVRNNPDVILLDINMPDMNGYEVCSKIREYISSPIIFLSARIEDIDKIKGFSVGGDDYVMKPFSIGELGARVQAHIRRENRQKVTNIITFTGELTIDYSGKEIKCNGQIIQFTNKEYKIIELLSTHPGQVFDKDRIYEKLWGWDSDGDSSVIGEHIRRIRNKLLEFSPITYIETVWGMGYKWLK